MNTVVSFLLLSLIAGSVLFCLTSARNTACFNANGEIKRVYCDGQDITNRLAGRNNPRYCGCILLKVCANITIRAIGYQRRDKGQTRSGIGVCQTSFPTPYRDWVCMKSSMNKNWKDQSMNVKNTKLWRPAKKRLSSKRCYKKAKLPCKPYLFWNSGVDATSVDCVLQQCGDACNSCDITGPGKCDPGMCTYGSGENVYTRETRCNRRCRLDLVAWGLRSNPATTGSGYMRLIDMRSKSRDIIHANTPGFYIALVDMNQCIFSERYYSDWSPAVNNLRSFATESKLKTWVYDTATMANRIAVILQVGGVGRDIDRTSLSPAPLVLMYNLGTGSAEPIYRSRNCSASVVLKGFNYGPTTVESVNVLAGSSVNAANYGC